MVTNSVAAEVVPEASVELLMLSMLKEINQDVMLKIVAYGNAKVLSNILTKSPERVHISPECLISTMVGALVY